MSNLLCEVNKNQFLAIKWQKHTNHSIKGCFAVEKITNVLFNFKTSEKIQFRVE